MRVQGDSSVSLGAARLLCGRLRERVVPNRHVCKAVVLVRCEVKTVVICSYVLCFGIDFRLLL